jgi:serine/threonine protein kinase
MIGGIPKWMFDQCTDFQLLDTIKTNKWSENEDLTDIRELLAFDSTLQDLIMRMLDPDPQKRISLNQAIMHPFFDSIRVEAA